VTLKKDISSHFWFRRHSEGRNYVYYLLVCNQIFQTKAMFQPMNESHFWVNVGYTLLAAVITAVMIYSHKSENLAKLACPALFVIAIRNTTRLLDLE